MIQAITPSWHIDASTFGSHDTLKSDFASRRHLHKSRPQASLDQSDERATASFFEPGERQAGQDQ